MTAPLLALVIGALLAPLVVVAMAQWAVLDVPNERSSHHRPTPRGGGISIAAAATLAIALGADVPDTGRVALAAAPLAFGLLGLGDDLSPVSPLHRLLIQAGLAGGAVFLLLDDLSGPDAQRTVVAIIAVVWLVGYVNAFNFMDGANGLAAATAIIGGGAWWCLGRRHGAPELEIAGAVLSLATVGFFAMNFPRARIFLGDVGSYFVGAWSAVCVVLGLMAGLATFAVLAPVVVVVGDTAWTLFCRVRRGASPFTAHRDHVYQRLIERGWSHAASTLLVAAVTTACSGIGLVAASAGTAARIAATAAIALLVCGYVASPSLLVAGRSRSGCS